MKKEKEKENCKNCNRDSEVFPYSIVLPKQWYHGAIETIYLCDSCKKEAEKISKDNRSYRSITVLSPIDYINRILSLIKIPSQ